MFEDREQLEFAISQYVDGALSPIEHEALERQLREDPEAAELLREYRQLETVLRAPGKMPSFNWEAVAQQISAHVDGLEEPAVAGRIGFGGFSMKMSWGQMASMALAACLLLAFGIVTSIMLISQHGNAPTQSIHRTMFVKGPTVENATAAKVVEIAIGPSADAQMDSPVVQRTPIVTIAADSQVADATRANPFD